MRAQALVAAIFVGIASANAGEREDAVAFLNTSLKCPPPHDRIVSDDIAYITKSNNKPLSTSQVLFFQEHYETSQIGINGGESYQTDGYIEVRAAYRDVETVAVKKSKVTVQCRGGIKCLSVDYHVNGDGYHTDDGVRESKKTSYRISTCSNSAAKDIRDAILFLSR